MDINKNAPSGLSSGRYDSIRHIPPSTAGMTIFLTSGFACMILFITFAPPRPKTRQREGRDFTATSRPLPTSHDGEVLEWLKRRAWKVRIPQKGIAGSNPAFSARYPSDPLKAPPNFGGAFRLYASGERSESSQAVYPAARILRSPRRAAERFGRARFGPADSGSYVGRRSGSGNPRRIDPYILSTLLFRPS